MALPVSPNDDRQHAEHRGDERGGVAGKDVDNQEEVGSKEEMHDGEETEELRCKPCDPVGEEIVDEEVQEEAEVQRPVTDPGQPTQAMIDEHDLTHSPFRPWCEACVRGRAADAPSRKVKGGFAEHVLPRVRMDYCFLTEEVEEKEGEHGEERTAKSGASITVAVMQESLTRSVWAYAVSHKGSREDWLVDQVIDDLETIGLKNERIVLKSDQEPSITDVMKEVQKRREADFGTAIDTSKVGNSDSNGTVEAAIKSVEGMTRTLRFAVEAKIGEKLPIDSPMMPWLIRHAGHLITRCWIRPNGRTSYELIKGRRSNAKLVTFGESVLFRVPHTKTKPGKFEELWEHGVYVGFVIRSGEDLVATPDGVFKVSTLRRRPLAERWSSDMMSKVAGTPAAPVPGRADRRSPAYARKFAKTQEQREAPVFVPQPEVEEPEIRVRNFKILKTDIREHGPTDNCPGCRAVQRNATYKAAHTAECRARFEGLLKQSEGGRARLGRADDRITHAMVRQEGMDPHQDVGPEGGEGVSAEEHPPKRPHTRGEKRTAEDEPDDEGRGDGADGRPGSSMDHRHGTHQGSLGPEPRLAPPAPAMGAGIPRGSKRAADTPPDDPRVPGGDGDDTAEISAVSQGEMHRCGQCQEVFTSRNDLFKHLRAVDHIVESDDEEERDAIIGEQR